MKTFLKILLGCLAVPFILLVATLVVAIAMRQAGPPQHRDERAALEQPVQAVTLEQLASEGLSERSGAAAGRPLPVNIRLEEGNFAIVPAPEGSSIRVEGDYDAGVYELNQELVKDRSGQPTYNLVFRPRYSMLRRILTEGGIHIDKDDNRITVHLPRGVPIALNAQISKGTSTLQLGGLALQKVALDLRMGEHAVSVEERNSIEMAVLELNVGMGEMRLQGLGNLRAAEIAAWGKMGEVRLDLGDEIARDTKLFAKMTMGEMTVGLPRKARLKTTTSVFLGERSGLQDSSGAEAEESGYLLQVDAGVSLGELRFQRH